MLKIKQSAAIRVPGETIVAPDELFPVAADLV